MVPTEGDEDGLRMTNLKELGQFFSRCVIRDVAPLKKFSTTCNFRDKIKRLGHVRTIRKISFKPKFHKVTDENKIPSN